VTGCAATRLTVTSTVKRRAASEVSTAGEHAMQQYGARKSQVVREIYLRAFAAAALVQE
jgi:hypothetical protein